MTFGRRDIMKEVNGEIIMQLPHFFKRWIRDVGVIKLIASTLADDMENQLQKANEVAKAEAGEIENLIKGWPSTVATR